MQIGKKTSGDMIDPTPERKEGFATATFDLEAIRWQRARYTSPPLAYRTILNFKWPPKRRSMLKSLSLRRTQIVSKSHSPVNTASSAQCCVAGDFSETGDQTCMDPC